MRRTVAILMGSRPARRVPNPPFLHMSQQSPYPAQVNYEELQLKYKVNEELIKKNYDNLKIQEFELGTTQELPFAVDRTLYGKQLPVYTDFKAGRTKVITILRKVRGDIPALKEELQKIVDGREVKIQSGKLVVDGNYKHRIARWLAGLGF